MDRVKTCLIVIQAVRISPGLAMPMVPSSDTLLTATTIVAFIYYANDVYCGGDGSGASHY